MKIIAEVGSNVKSLKDCEDSIIKAKHCGADIVKFQYFNDWDLYGCRVDGFKEIIDPTTIPDLRDRAKRVGIDFACTFFNPEILKTYDAYIDIIKIASSDMLYSDLLEVAKDLNKPILLSTGGHSTIDIQNAMKILNGAEDRVTLMYCESVYPARCTDMRKVEELLKIHDKVGFSDHSVEIFTHPMIAYDMGCEYIEKHVNFCGYDDTPDAPHSLSEDEFKRMVKIIKEPDNPIVLRSGEEEDMVTKHNRRLIATEDINKGETFVYGSNFGQYRSMKYDTNGYPPFISIQVDGKKCQKDIKKGDSIGPKEVNL